MIITNQLTMDLQNPGSTPIIHAVQTDTYSRKLEITLLSSSIPYAIANDARAVIRYKKFNGQGGEYDTLPDGTRAWSVKQNVLTVAVAPQVLNLPGSVSLTVSLITTETQTSTSPIVFYVQPVAFSENARSENYYYVTDFLPAPANAEVGQHLQVSSVNEKKKITELKAVTPGGASVGDVTTDLIKQHVEEYLMQHPPVTEEHDPTVADWAKQPQKPSYTAQDVGADPAGTAQSWISAHDAQADSHKDIRAQLRQLSENAKELIGIDQVSTFHDTNPGASSSMVVTLTDGTTHRLMVYNGVNGEAGSHGKDGTSPAISVSAIMGGHRITITDSAGTKSIDVMNGSDGRHGSDASVTAANIKTALGYTPADSEAVHQLSESMGDSAVPDYVKAEAEAVIDRVIAAQGSRTFTFAAISDLHYGNGSYTDGILHACQALKYIDGRVKLDAVAVLGDYTDGYPSTSIADAMADFKAVNGVLDKLRFARNLRQQGNHDYYEANIPVTRRLIQYYSDDVIWGSRAGGYFHKDFEDQKIRIICPNTNENNPMDASSSHPSSSISMTAAQMQWLVNTLDLSAKNDAEEWGILILSHHPLDYWTSDSQYLLGYILNAYKTGSSWSGGGVSCNFTGKNSAKLIGNIHGHIHNLLTDRMFMGSPNSNTRSEVYRSCVPNACYDRENQYTGTWGESAAYIKTQNSAKDTAFMVYTVNLDAFTVNGFCYGAGADRSFAYGEVIPEIYTVTNNLTNITTNNSAVQIEEGQAYTATLTPTGASISSVVVTMGGVNVTSSVYSNGSISIASVTGNIVITAVGAEPVRYTNQIPISIGSDRKAYNGGQGWKDGYRLNSSGAEAAAANMQVTGYIPAKTGDTFYLKNIDINPTATGGNWDYTYIAFYDSNFSKLHSYKFNATGSSSPHAHTVNTSGYVDTILVKSTAGASVAYMRISCRGITSDSIITANEPIA